MKLKRLLSLGLCLALLASLLTVPAAAADKTLTLREDWRLTSDLDLNVPEGDTLTISGNGFYIYEMGGKLLNSGLGRVTFTDGTILYPVGDSETCTTATSNQLMLERQPHRVNIATNISNGTVISDKETATMGDTVALTVTPASGYVLSALTVTDAAGNTVTVSNNTFTMPANAVTVTATFKQTTGTGSSSGGGGGGSSSGSSSTTETNPDGSTTTTVTNKATGTVTETTKNTDGSTIVVETRKDGTVTTTETDKSGNVTGTVENPDGSVEVTVENKDGTESTTTIAADGQVESEVTLPAAVVDTAAQTGDAIPLPIPEVPVSSDADSAPVVTIHVGSDAPVKVKIPVEDVPPGTVAVIVHADGTQEVLMNSIPTDDGLSLPVNGDVTVKVVDNSMSFSDVNGGSWYKDAADFASSRGLMNGVGGGRFGHGSDASRAMVWTMLARLDGHDVQGSNWKDASRDWAMNNDVSDGKNQDGSITREQLAVMLWRYAGEPASSQSVSHFTDAHQTSDWAQAAMRWAVEIGVLNGKGDGNVDPKGNATRAHIAQMFMNYMTAKKG